MHAICAAVLGFSLERGALDSPLSRRLAENNEPCKQSCDASYDRACDAQDSAGKWTLSCDLHPTTSCDDDCHYPPPPPLDPWMGASGTYPSPPPPPPAAGRGAAGDCVDLLFGGAAALPVLHVLQRVPLLAPKEWRRRRRWKQRHARGHCLLVLLLPDVLAVKGRPLGPGGARSAEQAAERGESAIDARADARATGHAAGHAAGHAQMNACARARCVCVCVCVFVYVCVYACVYGPGKSLTRGAIIACCISLGIEAWFITLL